MTGPDWQPRQSEAERYLRLAGDQIKHAAANLVKASHRTPSPRAGRTIAALALVLRAAWDVYATPHYREMDGVALTRRTTELIRLKQESELHE